MKRVVFKDVVKRINNNVDRHNTHILYYVGGEHIESNEFMIHDKGLIKGSTIGYKFHYGFEPRHILFMSRNPHLRKASMVDFEGICSDSTYVVESRDENILLQEYLLIEMQSDRFWQWAEEHKSGGVNYLINYATLETYEFDLPHIDEQRVLADKLWAAYRLKESYRKLLVATQEMVKSQFIEMFYGMETTPVKDYIDDSFPGEWGTEDKDGNGVKVIRTTNFTNSGKLNLADVVTRSIEDRKVARKQIKKYDTILERSGGTTDNPVGRVVLFEEDDLFLCNNFTQVLRFKDVDPRFVFYALYYFYQTNRTAIRSMGSKTTGIQNLNMSKYLEIGIPNASDEDQEVFVTIAEQADKSEFELRKSIEAIDQVIKSLINNK